MTGSGSGSGSSKQNGAEKRKAYVNPALHLEPG